MQQLMRLKGPKAIGIYWTLVELCAEKLIKEKDEDFTEAHCVFEFDRWYLRDTLATHQLTNLTMYLRCFADLQLMSFTCVGDVLTISMPKLLECMDRDTKRARTPRAPSAPKIKNKEEDKEEDKDICTEPSKLVPALVQEKPKTFLVKISSTQSVELPSELILVWAETYPKDFLDEELKKARAWVLSNPHKAPKSAWGRFFNSWFARGWEKYRTTLKSNPTKISVEDLDEILGAA